MIITITIIIFNNDNNNNDNINYDNNNDNHLHHHHHQSVLSKSRSFTANSGTKAAVLPKDRSSIAHLGTKVAVLKGMNRYSSFPLLSTLQIVGLLKITPHSYPWLEVDIGKIMCPLFCSSKYGNPTFM